MRSISIRIMAIVCLLAVTAWAQQATEPKVEEPVTRTYLIGDLVRNTANYPLPDEWRPSQAQPTSQPTESDMVDSLIRLIQDTVASETWKDNGGNIGSVREMHAVLVVTQTKDNHAQILNVLEELRRSGWAAQLTIRATWVVVNQGDVSKPMTEVTPDWLSKQKIYCESQVTCFSGQTVHVTSGREKRIISDLTPIVGTQAVAQDPTIEQVRSGVSVQFCPMLISSESAVVDVQSSATEWQTNTSEPAAQLNPTAAHDAVAPAGQPNTVDRVPQLKQEMKTTMRVPLKKKILVGGMTLDPSDAGQGGRQLCLIVEVDGGK